MEFAGESLPKLERVDTLPGNASRTTAAHVLRDSPALRTLAEIVRLDEDIFDTVAAFGARREDFRLTYSPPGRTLAPWLAGIAHAAPELYDAAFEAHFDGLSKRAIKRLESDQQLRGFSYWPTLQIGTGPQSQILASALLANRPEAQGQTLIVDQNPSVGGTFQEWMSFKGNSRNRPQTDDPPVPGTKGNINPLVPGIMTPADYSPDTYASVDDLFRRPVVTNHALHGMPIGLNLRLVAFTVDGQTDSAENFPGKVTAIVQDTKTQNTYSIRTNALVASTGNGEPNFDGFPEETREVIKTQRDLLPDYLRDPTSNKRPLVITHEDLYRIMYSDKPFPLKGVKKVALIGDADGGCTAAGTLLGYEPRDDGSVMQIDRVESIDWFGQEATDDESFLEKNRTRYGNLALEFPRRGNRNRDYRIRPKSTRADRISTNEAGNKANVEDDDGYDLVVLAAGFKNNAEQWATSLYKAPMQFDDPKIQRAITDPLGSPLEAGETILLPQGYNLERILILGINLGDPKALYTVALTDSSGGVTIGSLAGIRPVAEAENTLPTLGDYCDAKKFGAVEARKTARTDEKIEYFDLLKFDEVEDLESFRAFLKKGAVLFPTNSFRGNSNSYGYSVFIDETSSDIVQFEELTYDQNTGTIRPTGVATNLSFTDLLETLDDDLYNSVFASNRAIIDPEGSGAQISIEKPQDIISRLDELTEKNAIIVFIDPPGEILYAALYESGDEQFYAEIASGIDDQLKWRDGGRIVDLQSYLSGVVNNVKLIIPNPSGQTPTPEAKVSSLLQEQRGLTFEAFNTLYESDKKAYLRPGTVIFTGNYSSSNTGAYMLVDTTDGLRGVRLKRSLEAPGNLVEETNAASVNLSDLLLVLQSNFYKAVIHNNPALTGNSGVCRVEPTTGQYVIDNLEELARQGAVLSTFVEGGDNRNFLYTFNKNAAGEFELSYVNEFGYAGTSPFPSEQTLDFFKSLLSGSSSKLGINRIIFPPDNTDNSAPASATTSLRRATAPRSSFAVMSDPETAKPIAKRFGNAPVYLVGPAADLPIDPDVTRLIPNIPANTASIFGSQPRVVALAGKIALGQRRIQSSQPPLFTKEALNTEETGADKDLLPLPLRIPIPLRESSRTRITPDASIKLGLGIASRSSIELSTIKVSADGVKVIVRRDRTSPESMLIIDNSLDIANKLTQRQISELFDNPLVADGMNRMLTKPNGKTSSEVKEVTIEFKFDERGLNLGTLKITPVLSIKNRSPKPKPIKKN